MQKICPFLDLIPDYTQDQQYQVPAHLNIYLFLQNIKDIVRELSHRAVHVVEVCLEELGRVGAQGVVNSDINLAVIEFGLSIFGEGACGNLHNVQDRVDKLLGIFVVVVVVLGGEGHGFEQAGVNQHMFDAIHLLVEPASTQHYNKKAVDLLDYLDLQLAPQSIVGHLLQQPRHGPAEGLDQLGALSQNC